MARISLFGLGRLSKSAYVTAKSMVNMYAETRPQGEKSLLVAFPTPGLNLFTSFGASPNRGGREFEPNAVAYIVNRGILWEVNNAAVQTNRGTLSTTSGRVSLSDNGVQILIVDGTFGYCYTTATASAAPQSITAVTRAGIVATITTGAAHGLSSGCIVTVTGMTPAGYNGVYTVTVASATTFTYNMVADPGANTVLGTYTITPFVRLTQIPANPQTVTFLGGRFIVNLANSGRYYYSDLYDGISWPALNFANAESNPDPLSAVWSNNNQLFEFGTHTTEYSSNSGTLDSAFAQINGASTEWGLAARWSVAKFDNSVACLITNRMGQVMVAKIAGYLPQKISTIDIDSIINGYTNVADATAYSYMLGGHPMYVINFPSAGASWLYDGSTSYWSSLVSTGQTRHIGEFSIDFSSIPRISDFSNGNLYNLSPTGLTENGTNLNRIIVSETVASPDGNRITVNKLRLDMEVGNGLAVGQGSNPVIGLEVSRDNGKTYGAQMWQRIGAVGEFKRRVEWTRLGTAYNFVFRLTVSDPVNFVLVSASINPDD